MLIVRIKSNVIRLAVCCHNINVISMLVLALFFISCSMRDSAPASGLTRQQSPSGGQKQAGAQNDSDFEATQTQKVLGVPLKIFPPPQGLAGFDEIPAGAPEFKFTVAEEPLSGTGPLPFYEGRQTVQARAPDGSVYEAYVGYDNPDKIIPGHGFVSTLENRRQAYGTHYGYAYYPQDVFIGKPEGGRLKPTLFFRDVGSHTTAPHYLAIDAQGQAHLAVADVNISQNNQLDLYWVIGNPMSGKWTAAWLIDHRGFTSWSHPWSAAWGNKVSLLWTWCDVSINKGAPGMGLFHLEWSPDGFGRKVRVISGALEEWDAAIDPQSGRLLIAFSKDDGVYVISRSENGVWTRATHLSPWLNKKQEVAVQASKGAFIIRTGWEDTKEWLLRPR